ncbi:MAG: hypothetical protein K1X86_05095 [Ignavibacteria bacterium]|nr:hypothetical protein [Ignavibacteria bacterium]
MKFNLQFLRGKTFLRGIVLLLLAGTFATVNFGCSAVDTFTNLQRLQFKLGSVNNFNAAGVNVSNLTSFSQIGILDIANLTANVTQGKLPVGFTLNLIAKNPNTAGGSANSSSLLKRMEWNLYIDDTPTINGVLNNIVVPGTGQESTIPMTVSMDLMQYIKGQGLENLVNLALAIGGRNGSSSRLSLRAKPTVEIFGIPVTSPEITIVSHQFSN